VTVTPSTSTLIVSAVDSNIFTVIAVPLFRCTIAAQTGVATTSPIRMRNVFFIACLLFIPDFALAKFGQGQE
jgi:hypothetical protein